MDIRTTALAAATFGLCVTTAPARASDQGILTCQITLSQFAEDVTASKARLSQGQLHDASQIVDIGRSQCRSTPQLVMTNVRAARNTMRLTSAAGPTHHFSDFWPATPQEEALLR